jgi:hypothetical protein
VDHGPSVMGATVNGANSAHTATEGSNTERSPGEGLPVVSV